MAKEHIELLEAVKARILATSDCHMYICNELRNLVYRTRRFDTDSYATAARDIASVISCMFRVYVS